jgi:hypothetical protein
MPQAMLSFLPKMTLAKKADNSRANTDTNASDSGSSDG